MMDSLPADLPLDPAEQARLAECESTIERGLSTFGQVGAALLGIRDGRLYRDTHRTWETYLSERWHISRAYAHRTIEAAEVASMLPNGNVHTEAVARELVPVMRQDPTSLPAVMAEAVERSAGQPVTASVVRSVVRERMRSEAALAEQELQEATAHWSPAKRAEWSPERMRQQGELMRLAGDIAALPDPGGFVSEYPDLPQRAVDNAEAAHAWLAGFLSAWRRTHGD